MPHRDNKIDNSLSDRTAVIFYMRISIYPPFVPLDQKQGFTEAIVSAAQELAQNVGEGISAVTFSSVQAKFQDTHHILGLTL